MLLLVAACISLWRVNQPGIVIMGQDRASMGQPNRGDSWFEIFLLNSC
jgi:hypothetical protein